MNITSADSAAKHTIPVIHRMMELLGELERHAEGLSIRELVVKLELPRTTIYRILNTLQTHEVVRRDEAGLYHLGRRLLILAANASTRFSETRLSAICQPHLEKLAAELGEGVKLNVLDDEAVMVLAAVQGRREYALTVAAGQRTPIHSGAAGKLLLAFQPVEIQDLWLSRPLPAYTDKTYTDANLLRAELTAIRARGWARDAGENAPSIQAFAAPVLAREGAIAAAVSVPFLAGASEARMDAIRDAVVRAARGMTEAMPG